MIDKRMTFGEHLEELRSRLTISLLVLVLTTVFSFIVAERWLFPIIKAPAPEGVQFVTLDPTGNIGPFIRLSLTSGVILGMPLVLLQIVLFITSALGEKERRFVLLMLPVVLIFFFGGIAFGYFVILPPTVNFMLSYGNSSIAVITPAIGRYISMVTILLLWLGIAFEIPPAIYVLARVGIVSSKWLIGNWRIIIVGAFVIGAIITPTADPVNQSLVSVPLIILYLFGIVLARIAEVQRKRSAIRQAKSAG
ncbi:MAG: twin-arginine translocase subunit TatC [Dehalococcoidia bacterium]|nr:twin-arginine translocase subunit TatC [Dehalococcoidia bacterium]